MVRPLITIQHTTALELLRSLEDCSVDSIVCDPPSGIGFMSSVTNWDRHSTYEPQTDKGRDLMRFGSVLLQPWEVGFCAFIADVFSQCLRVIKPGGHALVWALPRTSDLTALGLRVAGWEIRDSLAHMFGSGFPKSLDVSKSIDKAQGAEREVLEKRPAQVGFDPQGHGGGGWSAGAVNITKPATPEAQQWAGYGTALKPGHETWWLIRKPISGTVAQNVMTYGTGGLNIDGCRVSSNESAEDIYNGKCGPIGGVAGIYSGGGDCPVTTGHDGGRWPPNVLLTHSAGCKLVGSKVVRGSAPASGPTLTGKSTSNSRGVFNGVGSTPSYEEEEIQDWQCEEDCPVKEVGDQSGETSGSGGKFRSGLFGLSNEPNSHNDKGTAARFYPQFKWECEEDCPVKEVGDQSGESVSTGGSGEASRTRGGLFGVPKPATGGLGDKGTAARFYPQFQWECEEGCPVKEVGDQSGESVSTGGDGYSRSIFAGGKKTGGHGLGDKGTAARFYPQFQYVPKPSRAEREAGCDHLPPRSGAEVTGRQEGSAGLAPAAGAGRTSDEVKNIHPTVKSVSLMRWLTRLVTPRGGLVLDPFVGSGTTALACIHEGFSFIGSEQSADYVQIARARVDYADPAGAIQRRATTGETAPQRSSDGQGRLF